MAKTMIAEPAPEAIDPSPDDPEAVIRIDRPIKWMLAFYVAWFVFYPIVLIGSSTVLSGGNPSFDFSHFGLILPFMVILGNLLWLYAGWNIYDTLFTMAEGRWPIAGEIRKIVSPLVRMLFSHHH
jgi:heme A synthase